MYLCPICDSKITGKWCKECHRFVTPYYIKEDIHINEAHSKRYENNCTYHNPKIEYDKQEYMYPGYEDKIYGAAVNTLKNKTDSKNKKSPVRIVKYVFIIYFVAIFAVAALQLISAFVGKTAYDEYSYDEDDYYWEEDVLDVYQEYYKEKYEAIAGLTPALEEKDEFGYTNYFYEPADIVECGYPCDMSHMDLTADELIEAVLPDVCPGYDLTYDMYCDERTNILSIDEEGNQYAMFERQYELSNNDKVLIYISEDTATSQVHNYFFVSGGITDEFCEVVYNWYVNENEAEFDSPEAVRKYCEELEVSGEQYEYFELENYRVVFMTNTQYTYFMVDSYYY